MRSRRARRSKEEKNKQSQANQALKLAFKHEVHPQDYLLRVWVSAIVASGYFAYSAATKSGAFDLSLLLPLGGGWHGHDPAGALYLETWSTVLVDSLQVGFALWGGILIFLGIFRLINSHKYVFACFYLGIAFIGFVLVIPNWTQVLMNMLIDKCPVLVQ